MKHFAGFAGAVCAAALTASAVGAESADAPVDHVSCKGADNEIVVTITGIKKSVGLITADLYPNAEEKFLKGEGRVSQVRFAARSPMTQFCIQAPASDDYAIAVYHDRNANLRFDKNALGLPAEPYGVSNNPVMRLGPPAVTEALFTVAPEGARVEIDLRS